MKLPIELFRAIVGPGKGYDRQSGGSKRSTGRIACGLTTVILRNGSGNCEEYLFVTVNDLSRVGIGLQCAQPMNCGESILIYFPLLESPAQWLRYKVLRCNSTSDPAYQIGGEFLGLCQPGEAPAVIHTLCE